MTRLFLFERSIRLDGGELFNRLWDVGELADCLRVHKSWVYDRTRIVGAAF